MVLRESDRYKDGSPHEVFFSDSVESPGSNSLDVIERHAFLIRPGKSALPAFLSTPPSRFERADSIRSITRFMGGRNGPIRSLDVGGLKNLLENPSESTDLFRNSRPTIHGALAVVMKGTGRASPNYSVLTFEFADVVARNAPVCAAVNVSVSAFNKPNEEVTTNLGTHSATAFVEHTPELLIGSELGQAVGVGVHTAPRRCAGRQRQYIHIADIHIEAAHLRSRGKEENGYAPSLFRNPKTDTSDPISDASSHASAGPSPNTTGAQSAHTPTRST